MSLKSETNNSPSDLGREEASAISLSPRSYLLKWWHGQVLFLHENGIRLQEWRSVRSVLYSEIQTVAVRETKRFTNGIHTQTAYKIFFTAGDERFQLKHINNVADSDSFPEFVALLIQRVAVEFKKNLELQGDGWKLDSSGFQTNQQTVVWNDIGYVDIIEGHIVIWRRNEIYPFARVPESSPQARILNEILEGYTKENPNPFAEDSLGRYLFKRHANKILIFTAAGLSAILLLSAVYLWQSGAGVHFGAIVLFLLCGGTALYGIHSLKRTFHFYQNGIIQEPGHVVFFYHRCDSLVYDVYLQFINALYAFTRVHLKLRDPLRTLKMRTQFYGDDPDLEQARVEMARKISERLYQKLATQEEIRWGKWGRIGAHEVHYLSTKLLGSNLRLTMRYTQPISYSIDSGKFYLFRAGEAEPLFEMDCAEENFYPGFFLLLKLVSEH